MRRLLLALLLSLAALSAAAQGWNPSVSSSGLICASCTLSGTTTLPGGGRISSAGNLNLGVAGAGGYRLSVSNNTAALPATPDAVAQFGAADGVNGIVANDSFGGISIFRLRRANGTAASPSAVTNGNFIGNYDTLGYGATGYSAARTRMGSAAAETWTDSAQGSKLIFYTTPIGTTTLTEGFRLESDGSFKFNAAAYANCSSLSTVSGVLTCVP